MMEQSVTNACFVYAPELRVSHKKGLVSAMPVRSLLQFVVKPKQSFFHIGGEGQHIRPFPFPLYKLAPCGKKIFKCYTVLK